MKNLTKLKLNEPSKENVLSEIELKIQTEQNTNDIALVQLIEEDGVEINTKVDFL